MFIAKEALFLEQEQYQQSTIDGIVIVSKVRLLDIAIISEDDKDEKSPTIFKDQIWCTLVDGADITTMAIEKATKYVNYKYNGNDTK